MGLTGVDFAGVFPDSVLGTGAARNFDWMGPNWKKNCDVISVQRNGDDVITIF